MHKIGSLIGSVALAVACQTALAEPMKILFVGNSYTFGRVDPVMSYNTANVDDLTRPRPGDPLPNFTSTTGTRAWEPHPWGGVPGIFKQMADQAGVAVDVSMSTRNAASLRGHFLNTATTQDTWDLRANIAKRKWDIVVLQEQSDASLPAGRGANANYPAFSAYADKIEKFIHVGAAENYREVDMYTAIYGSVDSCVAAGGVASQCGSTATKSPLATRFYFGRPAPMAVCFLSARFRQIRRNGTAPVAATVFPGRRLPCQNSW